MTREFQSAARAISGRLIAKTLTLQEYNSGYHYQNDDHSEPYDSEQHFGDGSLPRDERREIRNTLFF